MSPQTEVSGVPILTPAEVLELVARGTGADAVAAPTGGPLLAVDVDAPRADELPAAVRHLPCAVVGVGSLPETLEHAPDLDVLLTDVDGAPAPWRSCPEGAERALSTLALSVLCSPQAATTLVQVMRFTRNVMFEDALVAEAHAYAVLRSGPEFAGWRQTRAPRSRRPRDLAPVDVSRTVGTLAVTLRRTHVRNALDGRSRDGLAAAFELAAHDPTVERIELRSAGPDFCSGTDLDELVGTAEPSAAHLTRAARSPVRALRPCAHRTTAYVHGACVGAGVELAAAAGRVVATPGTTFELPEVRMGLIPAMGGTASIPRRIGRQRATWMALTGTPIDLATALEWGLADLG